MDVAVSKFRRKTLILIIFIIGEPPVTTTTIIPPSSTPNRISGRAVFIIVLFVVAFIYSNEFTAY